MICLAPAKVTLKVDKRILIHWVKLIIVEINGLSKIDLGIIHRMLINVLLLVCVGVCGCVFTKYFDKIVLKLNSSEYDVVWDYDVYLLNFF